MFASAPVFAAAHTGKPMASDVAASGTPKGEKSTPNQDKARMPAKSGETRAEVKQETRNAKAMGKDIPAGEKITPLPGAKQAPGGMASQETRAEVKKDAIAAEKSGSAVQAGEALSKAQQKGVKQ
ncbi:MAG: hypothetical protein ABIQ87_16355 [Rubrivivax sp.]